MRYCAVVLLNVLMCLGVLTATISAFGRQPLWCLAGAAVAVGSAATLKRVES